MFPVNTSMIGCQLKQTEKQLLFYIKCNFNLILNISIKIYQNMIPVSSFRIMKWMVHVYAELQYLDIRNDVMDGVGQVLYPDSLYGR